MVTITPELKLKIARLNNKNPYVDITRYELNVGFPEVFYNGFYTENKEIIIYVLPARTYEDKEKVVGYTGNSAGANIRIARGLSVRTGNSRGKPIRGNVRKYNSGDLIITNKRIVFIGENDNFEYKIDKISAVRIINRTCFVIQSGKQARSIETDELLTSYTCSFIDFVIKENKKGSDVYSDIIKETNAISPEELDRCAKIKEEIKLIKIPKTNKKSYNKLLLFLVFLFFSIGFIGIITNEQVKNETSNIIEYSDKQIIELDNHPQIFDEFEETKKNYENVSEEKVRVFDVAKTGSSYYSKSDEFLLYFENSTSNPNHVGEIKINLNLSDSFNNLTLDDVVKLTLKYLPMELIDENYEQHHTYKYNNKNTFSYIYSWKLNDKGIELHNNSRQELFNKFGFKIIHNADKNTYKIEIGVLAQDKSLDWINKYSENWNIDLKKYR